MCVCVCVCMYMCSFATPQLLQYKSAVVTVAMDFTRTHKSNVVAVVAAVGITRTHLSVVIVAATVEIYQDAQIRWCVMYHLCILGAIRCH